MSGESHADERTSLIDAYMAQYDVQDVTCMVVDVEPGRIFTALRGHDFAADPIAAALLRLRTLQGAVSDALHGRARRIRKPHLTVEDVVAPGSGFVFLGERPGREFAIGSIGLFWQPRVTFVRVPAGEFASFAQRGFAKLVWSVQVQPYGRSQACVIIDVRVKAFDAASLERFSRYWQIVGPFSRLIRRRAIAHAVSEAQSFFPVTMSS